MPGAEYSGSYATPRLELREAYMEYLFSPADMLIGTKVLASMKVPKKMAAFPRRTKASLLRPGTAIKRAPRGAYERDGVEFSDDSYECKERGHETPVDEAEVNFYAQDFDLESHSAADSLWKVMIDQEIDIANAVFDGTTNFTVGNGRRTNLGTAWTNTAAKAIDDVQTGKESIRARTGQYPDSFVVSAGAVPLLLKNQQIRDAIGIPALGTPLTVQQILSYLPAIIGLPKIFIGGAVTNTAGKGVTPITATNVWSTSFVMICKTAEPGDPLTQTCLGRTLFWWEDTPTDTALIEEYIEPQTRSKVMRARSFAAEKMLDLDLGQLLQIQ